MDTLTRSKVRIRQTRVNKLNHCRGLELVEKKGLIVRELSATESILTILTSQDPHDAAHTISTVAVRRRLNPQYPVRGV